MARAPDSKSGCWGFESLLACHFFYFMQAEVSHFHLFGFHAGTSRLSRLEAGRRWQGLEVSSYVCALAALHLPAAGRSSANATLAGFGLNILRIII